MRVFVLCTGRCGSTTFAKACSHIGNFTSGHETRTSSVVDRFDYPDNHIEIDNRLAWFLGQLERMFSDPVWVHLTRDPAKVAASFARRPSPDGSLLHGFAHGIIGKGHRSDRVAMARLMVDTIDANITGFLAGKERVVTVPIEDPHGPFDDLWGLIGAEGDLNAAHATLDKVHNR